MRIKITAILCVLAFVSSGAWAAPRLEVGAQMSRCEPTGDAAWHLDHGLALGVTATYMQHPVVGYGVDLVYHGWPRPTRMIENWDVSLHAVQTTAHVKVAAPVDGPGKPWAAFGVGGYQVFKDYVGRPARSSFEPGWFGSVGFDFDIASGARLGIDASYHHVWYETELGFDVTLWTLGAHLLVRP